MSDEEVQGVTQDEPSEADPVATAAGDEVAETVVHLGLLRIATRGPDSEVSPTDVETVTNALIEVKMLPESRAPKDRTQWGAAAREAYARWQDGCQVVVPEREKGTPDRVSLTRLGERTGFRVVD